MGKKPRVGGNIVAIDYENRKIFVKRMDGKIVKFLRDGWHIEEIGELKMMALPVQGTLLYCSPPLGPRDRHDTAYHCVQGRQPVVVKYVEGSLVVNLFARVVESVQLKPWSPLCYFSEDKCINYYDYAAINDGIDSDEPQLILSFANERGDYVGFTPVPRYRDSPVDCRVRYTSYDYFDRRFVTIETKIAGRAPANVVGVDGKIYRMVAYYAHEPNKKLARPGYSGSGAYVL